MTFWAKSLRVFHYLWEHGTQSVRRLARKTGVSKSRVHRLQQALARRGCHPASWWWETEAGRGWVSRLVVATRYTFGLQRGVGWETIREFCGRLRLATQGGGSPSALRGVMQALAAALLETAAGWEQDGCAGGARREIMGAVDETFLERMILGLMDLATGSLLLEEMADDRTYTTWKAVVEERRKALGPGVLYGVSDRAKALMQLAEQGLACLRMPACFPVVHELVKRYSLALGHRWRPAQQALTQAQEALARRQGRRPGEPATREARALVEARQAEVTRWKEASHLYRGHVERLALTLHPCPISGSPPQTSAQVANQRMATVEAIETFARCHQVPVRHAAMTKVRKQVPVLAARVAFWWQGVPQDLEPVLLAPRWRPWGYECLLPMV